jgi:5-methylcytosine-specific restriction endonuclease McrA
VKRTPLHRTTWQEIQARGKRCDVRGCNRAAEDDIPRCARHAPAYRFELSKLGELSPAPTIPDDPKIGRFAEDAKVHAASRAQVVKAQAKYKQSAWRKACLQVRPAVCAAAALGGCAGQLECDHIWPKSQGGPYVVENGAFLCTEHHRQKTDSELKYRRDWLGWDQVKWLADSGWVMWAADGSVSGRGWRHFEPVLPQRHTP